MKEFRELLFRGQTRKKSERVRTNDNPVEGNWEYGGILQGKGGYSILYALDENEHFKDTLSVYNETVGQYTGFKDKNEKRIFEDDILEAHYDRRYPEDAIFARVVWNNNAGCWMIEEKNGRDIILDDLIVKYNEVIGNIHDHPELLEVNKS